MKKKLPVVIIFCLMYLSCTNEDYVTSYYSNGQIKRKMHLSSSGDLDGLFQEFYKEGQIKLQGYYIKNHVHDTIKSYYQNGNIKEIGFMDKGKKSGWWYYYYNNGNLKKEKEYILTEDSLSLLNQWISYDLKGQINYDKSEFFKINLPDTINKGINIGSLDYYTNSKGSKSYLFVVIENEYKNKITKDTFADKFDYTEFAIVMNEIGQQTIEGDIIEQILSFKKKKNDSSEMTIETKSKRFTKSIFVENN